MEEEEEEESGERNLSGVAEEHSVPVAQTATAPAPAAGPLTLHLTSDRNFRAEAVITPGLWELLRRAADINHRKEAKPDLTFLAALRALFDGEGGWAAWMREQAARTGLDLEEIDKRIPTIQQPTPPTPLADPARTASPLPSSA